MTSGQDQKPIFGPNSSQGPNVQSKQRMDSSKNKEQQTSSNKG
jgi:hypothetical protein